MSTEKPQTNGYKFEDAQEIRIPVPWGHVSGKWWGSKEIQPILALHGRQDNAGSFDNLIPLLPSNISILCLDMPGHGLSSHYPNGQYYYVHWDGVMLLRRIIKYYNWSKVKLLGHSLGGAISFLYAATYPNEVEFVISLDIVSPCVKSLSSSVALTGDCLDKYLKYENLTLDSMPCYEYDEMIEIVYQAYGNSITKDDAKILMKRGMQLAEPRGHYRFARDARLKVALLGLISMDVVMEYASRIRCSYLNIRAVPGMKFDEPETYTNVLDVIKQHAERFEYHEVEGMHHVHLTHPERISTIISDFINS